MTQILLRNKINNTKKQMYKMEKSKKKEGYK